LHDCFASQSASSEVYAAKSVNVRMYIISTIQKRVHMSKTCISDEDYVT